MPERRDVAVDALRTTVTLLVVLHHSILAYAAFGHFDRQHYLWSTAPVVDGRHWAGFDLVILFNDGWFMAAMFAIAGLFVLPGLRRHGPARYLGRRVVRLGLPFVFAAVVLMPLAYFPSWRLAGASTSYWRFWAMTLQSGPWSAGPAWFLWVLLAFDAIAAGLAMMLRRPLVAVQPRPLILTGMLVAAAGSIGALLAFGPERWFSLGPFSVQASRVVLYATSFALGVLSGRGLASWRIRARPIACLLLFGATVGMDLLRPGMPVIAWRVLYGGVSVAFCFTTGLTALALARRFPDHVLRSLQRIGPDAFWIYLVHYVPMVWLQYALVDLAWPGAVKGPLVFVLTLGISWGIAAMIRTALQRRVQRIPSTSIIS